MVSYRLLENPSKNENIEKSILLSLFILFILREWNFMNHLRKIRVFSESLQLSYLQACEMDKWLTEKIPCDKLYLVTLAYLI